MENLSLILTNYSDVNFSEELEPLPIGIVAFAPVIFAELLAAAISNMILLALVILACVNKHNNNINIYLFSLSIGGLMGTFTIFCTLLLVLARTWILGRAMCVVNFITFATSNFLFIILYVIISRDKYIVARDSLFTRPSKKRAYVLSVVAWSIPLGIVVVGVWYPLTTILSPTASVVNGNFACFRFGSRRTRDRTSLVVAVVIFLSFWLIMAISTLVSFYNFVRVLLELRRLNKLRARLSQPRNRARRPNNEQDRPFYITAEENTAKSLALVFFIQFLSLSVGRDVLHSSH